MAEERKSKLSFAVDATEAKKGFEQIKADAKDMAQAVGQAGKTAGAGMEGGIVAAVKKATAATQEASQSVMTWTGFLKQNMGPAMKDALDAGASHAEAHSAAIKKIAAQWAEYKKSIGSVPKLPVPDTAPIDSFNSAQKRLMQTLERETILLTGGKAAWREHQAAMLGVTEAATPYIAKIKAADQSQVALGMSAKQTSFALRQVPMQFTDIFTSLASGQRPMQVLLQQGGQLKDLFGGIGPAARALGGYVLGLVNPFTIAAAAAGGLGYAFLQGAKELTAFQNAATLSGNSIALSASQFTAMRDSISGIATKGKAAEVLTEIASNGKIAGENIRGIAEAAILMERATGQATAKTIEQFAELAKSPADAAAKLNEQYNFLTAAVFKQIKALEEQGRATQAAELAEKTFADALKSRATEVLDSAGVIEKAWRGVTGAAKGAWDAMLNIGRSLSPAEKAGAAAADVARIQAQLEGVGAFATTGGGAATGGASAARRAALEQELSGAKQILAEATRRVEIEQRNTSEKAEQNRLQQLGIAFNKQGDEFLTKQQRMERELTKAKLEGQDLVRAGIITETDLTKRLNGIREKFKESGAAGTGQSEVASIRAKALAEQKLIEDLQGQLSGGRVDKFASVTDGEKLVIAINEELKTSISGVARAQKERALVEAQALVGKEKTRIELQEHVKALKTDQDAYEKTIDVINKQADATRDQALQQEAVNANFGKSKTAIEQMTLAQLQQTIAQEAASDGADPKYIAGLMRKVEWQKKFVEQLQITEFKQEQTRLNEAGRQADETTATLQLELSLLGRSQQEREKIIGQRRVEIELAKELARIDKLNLGTGPDADAAREKLKAKARANAIVEANNVASKSVLDEWQRTADSINQSLTDALLRGFESGKDFAKNLRDTLVNMFKTLVLRPIIQGVLAPVSGALAGVGQSITGGGGSSISGLGSMFGGSSSMSSMTPYLNTAGSALGYASAIKSASDGAWGNAVGTALGTYVAGPLGAVIGSAIGSAIDKAFGGETRAGAEYVNGTKLRGPSGGEIGGDQVRGAISSTTDAVNAALRGMGSTATVSELVSGLESSGKGKGFAYAGGTLSTGATFGQATSEVGRANRRGSMSAEQASAAYAEELKQATLQALQAADVPGLLGDYLRQLGDIDKLSGGALDAALGRINKALTEKQQLENRLLDMTSTELERLNRARDAERAAIDESNRALLNIVYLQEDVLTARENLAQAYDRESASLQAAIDGHRAYARQLRDFRDGLLLGAQSPLNVFGKTGEAERQFNATLAGAQAGDPNARSALTGASKDYLAAALASASTKAEYDAIFARVSAALTITAAGADAQATLGQQQLDVMKGQLDALGVLNVSVLSFADAFAAYTGSQAALEAAKVAQAQSAEQAAAQAAATGQTTWSKLHDRIDQTVQAMSSGGSGAILSGIFGQDQADAAGGGSGWDPNNIPHFATGGDFSGGWRIVGDGGNGSGAELEATGPARIFNSEQTRDILRGVGGGGQAVVAELQALRQDVARQQAALEAIAQRTFETSKNTREMKDRGVPALPNPDGVTPLLVAA